MSQLEATLALQLSRADFIKSTVQYAHEVKVSTSRGGAALEARLQMLETYWAKFEATHEKIIAAGGKHENLTALSYFVDKRFDSTLDDFVDARDRLMRCIEETGGDASLSSTRHPSTGGGLTARSTRRALPEIALPSFDGSYGEWRSFRDMFSSMVLDNPDISYVERMHYLRSTLRGDALQLISNLKISEDSFTTAWEILITQYENTRLLATAHFDRLLSPVAMGSPTAREIQRFVATAVEASGALEALGLNPRAWDPVLVHLHVRRLSPSLREAWANKLGDSSDLPTFVQLQEFLKGRARALQSLALDEPARPTTVTAKRTRSPTRSTARVHLTSTPSTSSAPSARERSWPVANRYPCSYCGGAHYIASCDDFGELSSIDRKKAVDKLYLCYNCLGRHSIRVCQTTRTCQMCQQRHHTYLHHTLKEERPQRTAIAARTTPARVAPPDSAPSTSHSSEASPVRSSSPAQASEPGPDNTTPL